MDRETRFQAEVEDIDRALQEGRIDENAATALREGAMADYDRAGYTWWKVLGGMVTVVAVMILVFQLLSSR
ncbi:hypothetical protein GA0111570_10356 [Raineyella antarctica]|uniref:Uncharacterized protein n=1 Tax=Raineyella antarctica TaxID=1577474 RepID=A0A1G6GFG4_9ACTN|nr:hypothetical protein [Raineyella antarctica]SDB80737.1 hypothetical protein GA0111570_10356 [Raineyella antarctica]